MELHNVFKPMLQSTFIKTFAIKINKIDKHLSRLNRKKRRKDSKSEMTKEILKLIQHKVKG